jgi:glycosyltransferase involved in cell wall biosynthesis
VVQHSSNPNKRFEEAKYIFSKEWIKNNGDCELNLVGRLDGKEYNYDFIRGENVKNLGEIVDRVEMSNIYSKCKYLIYPAFADSCPNTVLEARACGCEIIGVNEIGGTKELLDSELDISLERMGNEYYNLFKLSLT